MTEVDPHAAPASEGFKGLIEQASDQTEQAARERAAIKAPTVPISRKRAGLAGLVVSAPILALLLVTNLWGISLLDLITPDPAPEIAREQAQSLLDDVVQGIESFHQDYEALPEHLVQVGVPSRGTWTYLRKPDDQYQVVGQLYGRVVTFDSSERRPVGERHP
jgi:hypothetical protein